MVEAVIFDFDGTLVDSSPGIFHTALYSVRQLGITQEFSDEELRRFVGPPLKQCFRDAFNLDPALIDDAVRLYRAEYDRAGRAMMDLFPGMTETLQALKAMGLKLGVASYKYESLIRCCIQERGVAKYFSSVHGLDMAETLTKAQILELTVTDLGVPAERVCMVGDTENDLKGAEGAGTQFIGVSYGFGFREADGIHPFASSPLELVDRIKEMNGGKDK